MRNLGAAITFLTRVPLPLRHPVDSDGDGDGAGRFDGDEGLAAAVPWYPTVGALIGLVVGGTAAGLIHVVAPLVAAALAVVVGIALTGAFHEDGLADISDAFVGGWTRPERMRILKDPLHGSYGVAALCGSVVVRVACLATLGVSPAVAFAGAVAAHALGRCAAVALMVVAPSATVDGLGAVAKRSLPRGRAVLGVLAGVGIAALSCGWWAGPFVLAATVAAVAVGWLSIGKIGGVTGDVFGAAEQVAECLVLVTATALASRSAIWWVR